MPLFVCASICLCVCVCVCAGATFSPSGCLTASMPEDCFQPSTTLWAQCYLHISPPLLRKRMESICRHRGSNCCGGKRKVKVENHWTFLCVYSSGLVTATLLVGLPCWGRGGGGRSTCMSLGGFVHPRECLKVPFQGLESPWKLVKTRHRTCKSLKISKNGYTMQSFVSPGFMPVECICQCKIAPTGLPPVFSAGSATTQVSRQLQ